MVDGVTGVLYEEPGVEGLCAAIERFEAREWPEGPMRDNARRFHPDVFGRGLADAVLATVEERAAGTDTLIER